MNLRMSFNFVLNQACVKAYNFIETFNIGIFHEEELVNERLLLRFLSLFFEGMFVISIWLGPFETFWVM